jgi:hypothetical protein
MLLSHLYRDFLFSTITLDLPLYPALDVDVTATFDLATAWPVRCGRPQLYLTASSPTSNSLTSTPALKRSFSQDGRHYAKSHARFGRERVTSKPNDG